MATYDPALTFAEEPGVFRYAAYKFTSQSVPSDVEVYEYARDVAALIVLRTEKAGLRIAPPLSGISDTSLARVLKQANEVGAAFEARSHMFRLSGDERSERVMASMAAKWEAFMGKGSVDGGELSSGVLDGGGIIEDSIGSESGIDILANDVTQGHVTLADLDVLEVTTSFRFDRPD